MRTRLAFAVMVTLVGACATAAEEPEAGSNALSCEVECACTECNDTRMRACNENVDDLTENARNKSCSAQLASYLRCVAEDSRCVDGMFNTTICNAESSQLYSCLNGTTGCTSVNDGTCDEPEGTGLCAEGTDVADCAVSTCQYTNDGTCDEPEGTGYCAEGTDVTDCGVSTCQYTNNGMCDEPEGTGLCAEGTDVTDCGVATCPYTSDGECDEPEGTGLCAEGTDVADCAGGTCATCNEAVFGGSTLALCAASEAIYTSLYDCLCNGACAATCANTCNGDPQDAACADCMNASCASQVSACVND
jgi:hypothetical protein